MIVEFVFVLSLVYWTEQHLLFPVNFCHMAAACIHDNRLVCASTPDGCSRRTFLDQCDMYEFNCDYGSRYTETHMLYCRHTETNVVYCSNSDGPGYQETYILYCISSNLEGIAGNRETASSIKTTSNEMTTASYKTEDDRDSDFLEADLTVRRTEATWTTSRLIQSITPKHCPKIPTREPCPICPTVETTTTPKPLETTSMTTTKLTQITSTPTVPTTSKTTTTELTTTTSTPIVTTNKATAPTRITSILTVPTIMTPTPLLCCNRPATWSTTTVKIIPYDFPVQPIEYKKEIETTKQTDPPTTTLQWIIPTKKTTTTKTTKKPTTTSMRPRETTMKTSTETTTKSSTETTVKTSTETTVKTSTETIPCCNRPDSWSTTTEDPKLYVFPFAPDEQRTERPQIFSADEEIQTTITTARSTTAIPELTTTIVKPTTVIPELTTTTVKPTIVIPELTSTTMKPTTVIAELTTTTVKPTKRPTTTSMRPPETTVKTSTETISWCCNRPDSWYTTTEDPKPYVFPFEPDEQRTERPRIFTADEEVQTTITTTRSRIVIPDLTTTTVKPTTVTTTVKPTTVKTTITAKPTTTPFIPTTSTKKNFKETKSCCDRPATWSTSTTKKEEPYVPLDNSVENEIPDDPLKLNKKIFSIIQTDFPQDIIFFKTDTPSPTPNIITQRQSETTTTTKTTKQILEFSKENIPLKLIQEPENSASQEIIKNKKRIVVLKVKSTTQPWWYPTLCPSNNCQRPLVWSTTKSHKTRKWSVALGGWK